MQATAWILDLTHRTKRVTCDVPAGARAMVAVRDAAQRELGIALDRPLGFGALDTAPAFLFLVPRPGDGPGWTPLEALDAAGFALYVDAMLGGWTPPTQALDVFCFGNTPEMAARLAHLVVKGAKRGTAAWITAAERDGIPLPQPGLTSIVTDGFGHALCAIRTDRVEHIRFAEIGARHAWLEGEGDRSLEDWREGHLRYFTQEATRLGLAFTDDAMVMFEHFRVLTVFGRADP